VSAVKTVLRQFFAVRSADHGAVHGGGQLHRVLGPVALIAVGIGATIGSGIFALTGPVTAEHTGPAITLALLIAGVGCGLAALCYSEFASFLPVSGSAYSYAYATLGEGIAWFIGWNLVLEYALSASAVAVSWSGYVTNLCADAGVRFPAALVSAPLGQAADGGLVATGAIVNVPAVLVIGALSAVCYSGVRFSAHANSVMVYLKVAIIIVFIAAGIRFVDASLWHPYIPPNTGKFGDFGWSGVLRGAAIIFFSYVGFDTASTTALESRRPQRDVPIGILGALVLSGVLYVAVAAVMTGMVPYTKLNVEQPVAVALDMHPELGWVGTLVKVGVVAGMTSVILMSLLGQPRILLAMADDGLLPGALARCHARYRTPHVATVVTGVFAAVFAGLFPLDVLGELISIGILLAFAVVCIGVLVLRRTRPNVHRPFRVPWAPVTCVVGAVVCLALTLFLGWPAWWRLLVWSIAGFSIYAFYGYRHSRLRANSQPA